jgi:hypothetical protein
VEQECHFVALRFLFYPNKKLQEQSSLQKPGRQQ